MVIAADRMVPQKQIYNFLRSLTIKYEPIGEYLNNTLIANNIAVNEQDPSTWKYYRNMVGQYHESDTPMVVTSLDTRLPITLSPQSLALNPRTKDVYRPGGSYYQKLCETYPSQVDLIKSIVFPVTDLTKAVTAPNLTLLSYGTGYLEPEEEPQIVAEIERFLEIVKERWYFDFLDDEPYFYLTFWGSLQTYLAMLIMSSRMGYIHTPYVHSWHIWNALKAQGVSDYSDILDRRKAMMLYQNIGYLKANAGKQSNLVILANRLLVDFGVALYGRMVVQDVETNADRYQLTPQLVPVQIPTSIADLATNVASEPVATIQGEIFEKGLTPYNTPEVVAAIERRLGDTSLNNFLTKFLEIRPVPKNRAYADDLNMFLMETLVVAATQGYYTQSVEVVDPLTSTALYLLPSELLALYHYAIVKSQGLTPDIIPTHVALDRSFTTQIGTPDPTFPWHGQTLHTVMQVDATAYLSDLQYDTRIDSPQLFSEMLSRLWLRFLDHMVMDQNTALDKRHQILQYLSTFCHKRRIEPVTLVQGFTRYADWFQLGGIDIEHTILSHYDSRPDSGPLWEELADQILTVLVPMTPVLETYGNFTLSDHGYDRLRQLFIEMCSYRVVFLESERDTPEQAFGSKASTQYGPDGTQQYGDAIVLTTIATQDDTQCVADLSLYNGFTETVINSVDAHASYTVTIANITTHRAMMQIADTPHSLGSTTGVTMVQGPLRLGYTPPTVTGVLA